MALSMSRPAYDNILQRDQTTAASVDEYTTDGKSFPTTPSETHKRRATNVRGDSDVVDLSDAAGKDNQAMSDNEMDSEPAAKVQRGGGRRKQSKPLRMCAGADPVEQAELKVDGTPSLVFGESLHCDLCNEFCADEQFLKNHIRLVHGTIQLEEATDVHPSVPTKYHQLGQELGQELYSQSVAEDIFKNKKSSSSSEHYELPASENQSSENSSEHGWEPYNREDGEKYREGLKSPSRESGVENADNKLDSKNINSEAASPPQGGGSSGFLNRSEIDDSGGGSGRRPSDPNNQEGEAGRVIWDPNGKGRIFHPDAYCEICDREFCNKYFLKTHKANKHGIYDTSLAVPELPGGVGGGINNMFSIMNLLQHQQQQQQLQQQQQQQQDFSMAARNLLFPPLLPKLSASSSSFSAAKPPEKLVSTSPNAAMLSAMKGEDTGESSQNKTWDMEDYCDFCQKHFCNKYYLRKHKLDIHGLGSVGGGGPNVVPFSTSQDNNVKRCSSSAVFSSAGNGLDVLSSSALASLGGMSRNISGPTISSSASSVPPPGPMPPYLHNMANLMFLNPFAIIPPLFQTPGMPMYGSGGGSGSNGLAFPADGDVKNLSASSNGPSTSMPSPLDASMSGFPHNVLQSLGMNNAEAYLEMCRKEISKSYLMRNNATPEVASSGKRNLFSGEFAGFGGESSGGSRPSIKTESPSEKPVVDLTDFYKKTFSSLQGGKWDAGLNSNLAEELMRLEKFNGGMNESFDKSIFNNMVAAKMIDRVLCDICNKEVCNKYFLKTHKIKVHGWDPGTSDFEAALDGTTPIKRQAASPPPPPPPPQMTINFPPPPSKDLSGFDQLREDELVKMGIDPEAYCDICKKEFCSKYFLKTHRQNIHGIKPSDGSSCVVSAGNGGNNNNNNSFGLPMDYSFASMPTTPASSSGLTLNSVASSAHIPSQFSHLFAGMNHQINSSIYNSLQPQQAALAAAAAIDSGSRSGSEKRSFKWKEPGNAARVMCDICNKDLCNKYFLKTHMLKCHGINFDTVTGLRTGVDGSSSMSQHFYNNDDGGNDSSDDGGGSGHSGNPSSNQGRGFSHQRMRWENGADEKCHRMNDEGDGARKCQSPMNLVLTESNHVEPKFRIKSENLDRHHHASSSAQQGALRQNGSSSNEDSSQLDENSVAGSPLSNAKSLQQQAGETSVFARQSSEFDADKTRREENGPKSQNCDKSSGVSSEAATKAAIANHIRNQQNRKMFCCVLCQERFASRLECDIHTTKEHPSSSQSSTHGFNYATNFAADGFNNGRPSLKSHDSDAIRNTDARSCGNLISSNATNITSDPFVSRFGTTISHHGSSSSHDTISANFSNPVESASSPKTTTTTTTKLEPICSAQPTEPFDRSKVTMQLFNLSEETDDGGRHFLPSVVRLPTLCPVTESLLVTFTLTPVSGPRPTHES